MKTFACLVGLSLAAGCGGMSHDGDARVADAAIEASTGDAPDFPTDVTPDIPPDVAPDVHADIPLDLPETSPDLAADKVADVVSDVPLEVLPFPASGWRSGSRLKAQLLKAVDGDAVSFSGIFDSQLGLACVFGDPGDGSLRCIPYSHDTWVEDYLDASCTKAAFLVKKGTPARSHVIKPRASIECNAVGLYARAEKVTTSTSTYRKNPWGGSPCLPGGLFDPSQAELDLYAYEAVPLNALVGARFDDQPRGDGLVMRSWATDDGGYFPLGPFDVMHGTTCLSASIGPFAGRCVPRRPPTPHAPFTNYTLEFYTDTLCLSPISTYPESPCTESPLFAVGYVAPCTYLNSSEGLVPQAVAPVTRMTVPLYAYTASGPERGCHPSPLKPLPVLSTRGANLAPDSFPALAFAASAGPARLRSPWYTSSTGGRLQTTGVLSLQWLDGARLYDGTLETSCHAVLVSGSGQPAIYRCLPDTVESGLYYLDDQCSNVAFLQPKGPACLAPEHRLLLPPDWNFDRPLDRLYKAGALASPAPTKLYQKNDGTNPPFQPCAESGTFQLATKDAYETTPVAVSTFPAVVYVTE